MGNYLKTEVRKIAKEAGLSVANRPDSQGICFVGDVDARKFLARRLKEKKGVVRNIKGEAIGSHKGIWFYTIGQRGGWDIFPASQRKIAVPQRHGDTKMPVMYVVAKDAKKNELTAALEGEEKRAGFEVGEESWVGGTVPQCHSVTVRIRHGGELIKAKVIRHKDKVVVEMEEDQRGVAPGQSAVFYSKEGECLGGGVIR